MNHMHFLQKEKRAIELNSDVTYQLLNETDHLITNFMIFYSFPYYVVNVLNSCFLKFQFFFGYIFSHSITKEKEL